MSIWKTKCTLADLAKRNENTLGHFLGIEFLEMGEDYLIARMPVNEKTKQPIGIMHGGASCVLAETVGSNAANIAVDITQQYCVGLDINTNHIKAARQGFVIATTRPFHIGRLTQVWGIDIRNEADQLISVNRLTMAVLDRK